MKSSTKLLVLLGISALAYSMNPQVEDYQNQANTLFAKQIDRQAAEGNLAAKLGKVLGAKNLGEFLIRVDRHELYVLSYAEVYSTLDDSYQGTMIGLFGQIYSVPSTKAQTSEAFVN